MRTLKKNIHNAVNQIWPQSTVKGCPFHLGQSWCKKIQEFGPSREFVQHLPIDQYLIKMLGLPLLDQLSVGDCFSTEFAEIQPTDERVVCFLDYLVESRKLYCL